MLKQTLRFFLVLVALQAFWAEAQTTTTGAVSGTLTDSSGAVIPNSPVTLVSNGTGSVQNGTTNSAGAFQFGLLQPGSYTLTVSAPGFSKLIQQISVELGQVTSTDLKLSVSGSQQAINVTSEAPLLQTENGNVANTITQQQIRQVPNPGNDMTFVLNITPGAVTNGTTRTLFGLPNSSSLYTINGMDSNDPYYNGNSSGATNLLLGGSEVMEASVAGNAYSGQFGGLAGAQVNYVTRNGTNQYHGSATYYWTGRAMNANSWFNNAQGVARPFTNANQWAAGIGGPIKKNKLFFHANTEGLRVILPTSSLVLAPSIPFQQATLSNLLTRGLSASVPFYQQMFNLYNGAPGIASAKPGNSSDPLGCNNGFTGPNGLGSTVPCTVNFRSTVVNFAQEWNLATRVDYNLSDNDRFFIRFATDHGLQPTLTDPINPIFNAVSSQPSYTGQVNESHTFGTHGVNNLILSGGWYGAAFGPVDLAATLQAFPTQLTFADGSFSTLGGGNGTYPVFRNVSMAQVQDDLVFYRGNHTLKTGIKWRGNRINDGYFTRGTHGTLTPQSLGAFFNGGTDPSSGGKQTVYSQNFSTTANHQMQYWQIGGYVEDEWHAAPNLTLTASLRIDHASIPICTDGCFARPVLPFLQLNHDPTVPYNQALLVNQQSSLPGLQNLQWQPRAGFAWQPSGASSGFVIRGGAGIFFDAFPAVILDLLSLTPPGFNSFTVSGDNLALSQPSNLITDAGILNSSFLTGFNSGKTAAQIRASLPASLQPYYKAPGISSSDGEVKIYQVYKWNFEVQKSLGHDTTVSVNYVGNHGIHKPFPNIGLNAYSSTFGGLPTTVPDSRFGQVYYLQSDGLSSYNGMITSFRTRIRGNGVVQASYTWSHSLDSLSGGLTRTLTAGSDINSAVNPYNPNATYTTSVNDIRHYFMTNYVYTTPFRNPFLRGWQLSGTIFTHSGSPFTVTDNSTSSSLSSNYYGGTVLARYVGGAASTCSTPTQPCLLKSQFASAASVSSNLGRNTFRGPAYFDTDMAVMKQIPVPHWEAAGLNVGLQFFNLFNHPNFANPTNNFSSSTFGRITNTVGTPTSIFGAVGGDSSARIIQVKANFTF